MNMPGFTAEASIYKTRRSYKAKALFSNRESTSEPMIYQSLYLPPHIRLRDRVYSEFCEYGCTISYLKCLIVNDTHWCFPPYERCIIACPCPDYRLRCRGVCCESDETCKDGVCISHSCGVQFEACPITPDWVICCDPTRGEKCCPGGGCFPANHTCCPDGSACQPGWNCVDIGNGNYGCDPN